MNANSCIAPRRKSNGERGKASGSYASRAGLDQRLFGSKPEMKEMALSKDATMEFMESV